MADDSISFKENVKKDAEKFRKEKIGEVIRDEIIDHIDIIEKWITEGDKQIPAYNIPSIISLSKFSPKPYANELMKFHFFKYDTNGRFWVWDKNTGLWQEDAKEFIGQQLRKYLFEEANLKSHYVQEVTNHIKEVSYSTELPEDTDKNLIAFSNCLADINTGEIIPFSHNYFITSKLNIPLNPKYKDCPKIRKFFEDVLDKKRISILFDLISYSMYRGYPYEKLFILHGGGRNGKSTFLNLLTYILGTKNISAETPQDLASGDFSRGHLWNKMANISAELPYGTLDNTNTIKSLCGNDPIRCNRKFKEPFNFWNFAKLIFSGNELPTVNDKTVAWGERLYIIQFLRTITREEKIPNFYETLLTEEELSGLAWQCFQKLRMIKERGWVFEIDPDGDDQLKLYDELSNPLKKFLEEQTVESADGHIFKYEFKESFINWCKTNSKRIWSDREIGMYLKNEYEEKKVAVPLSDKRYMAWTGLEWKAGRVSK